KGPHLDIDTESIRVDRKGGLRIDRVMHVGDGDQLRRIRTQDLACERDGVSQRRLRFARQVQREKDEQRKAVTLQRLEELQQAFIGVKLAVESPHPLIAR